MNIIEEMRKYGVNIEEALERFMGNEALYIQMLRKFPASVRTHEVLEYMKTGDFDTALANAHTLKGVTGNLSIVKLYDAYVEIVQLLRAKENDKARTMLEEILPLQSEIINSIELDDE